jgi:hypothetical protein
MEPVAGSGVVRLSAVAARLIGSEADENEQLAALCGKMSLPPPEICTIICILAGSRNQLIRDAALTALRSLTPNVLAEFLSDPELHPRFLDLIARVHAGDPVVTELVIWHPAVSEATRELLSGRRTVPGPEQDEPEDSGEEEREDGTEEAEVASATIPDAENEEEEKFHSPYQQVQNLGIGDKIKMALTGNKEWRIILIKDTIKPVCCSVLKNPRITEAEVLTIARSSVQYDDIIRIICANREWVKKYAIRKALVENHRTPLIVALKLLATLGQKDLSFLSKSKNVASVIATQARKLALEKKK